MLLSEDWGLFLLLGRGSGLWGWGALGPAMWKSDWSVALPFWERCRHPRDPRCPSPVTRRWAFPQRAGGGPRASWTPSSPETNL